MAEPERLRGVGAGGVPMQVSVFRDKSAARCFGVLGIVGGSCTFLAGVTIVIIKASKGREKDEVLSYASIILIGVVIAALGVALSATAKGKRYFRCFFHRNVSLNLFFIGLVRNVVNFIVFPFLI